MVCKVPTIQADDVHVSWVVVGWVPVPVLFPVPVPKLLLLGIGTGAGAVG